MAALLAAGAASATASTSMAPSLRMRARAVERAHLVPHGFFFSFTTVALQTTPVDVVRNGVTYSMSMTVYQDTGSGGTLELRLSRVAPDGRAFQAHSYTFSPQSGIHLTYDKKTLQTAAARHDDRDHAEPGHGRVHGDVGEVEDVPALRRADGDEASRHGDAVVERVRRRDLDGAVLRDDPHAAGDGQDHQGPGLLAGRRRLLERRERRAGDPQDRPCDRHLCAARALRAAVLLQPGARREGRSRPVLRVREGLPVSPDLPVRAPREPGAPGRAANSTTSRPWPGGRASRSPSRLAPAASRRRSRRRATSS